MKITVGIPTYNRPDYLKKMAASLYQTEGIEQCNIRVYDDCSTEIDLDFLKKTFPDAKEIVRREKNLGSDWNLRQMYIDFINTGDDLFVEADSDLIFRPDWLHFLKDYFSYTDGIMSLYHSVLHPVRDRLKLNEKPFVTKEHIGSAGLILNQAIARMIIDHVPASRSFDWDWCRFLNKKGIRILVSEKSYFQHIGLEGFNCNGLNVVDYGLNFIPVNEINQKLLVEFFENSMLKIQAGFRKNLYYQIGYHLVTPLRMIKKLIK